MLEFYNEFQSGLKGGRFFQSLFTNEFVSNTEKVEIDVQRSIRLIANDVARGSGAGNTNYASVFTNKEYTPPLYWEETPVSAAMLNKRLPGQDPYSDTSRMEAMAYYFAQAQSFNAQKIINAIERMAVQAVTTGIITLRNQVNIDFDKKTTLDLTPSVKWDQPTANVEGDIIEICKRIYQAGKRKPNTIIMDALTWNLFLTRFLSKYNNSPDFIQPGRFQQGEIMEGASFQGQYNFNGYRLDIYVADDFYETPGALITDATTKVEYMPAYTVIVMDRTARLTKGFAATEILPQFESDYYAQGLPIPSEFSVAAFTPFAYPKPPSVWMAGVQSAPLVMPTAIDTIGTIVSLNT